MKILSSTVAFLCLAPLAFAQTVCIDPGHPSEVGRGTAGWRITEIQAVWRVAQRLKAKLEAAGVKVVTTKTAESQYVTNMARSRIANAAHADLFVRLHCDASTDSGFAVYYPDRQGVAHGRTGPSKALLARLAPMARRFHAALAQALRGELKDDGLRSDVRTAVGARQGALTGSIFSEVPVVLVEMCVLTNPRDEAFIASARGQERMAEALARATLAALEK